MILRTLITLHINWVIDLLITFGGCSLIENPINITNKISRRKPAVVRCQFLQGSL